MIHMLLVMCHECLVLCVFFFKQKTAYEMRISDWSSDVCSSDLKSVIVHLVAKLLAVVVAASDRHARKIGMRRGKHPEVQQPSLLDETPHGDRRDKLVIDQTKPLAPRRCG